MNSFPLPHELTPAEIRRNIARTQQAEETRRKLELSNRGFRYTLRQLNPFTFEWFCEEAFETLHEARLAAWEKPKGTPCQIIELMSEQTVQRLGGRKEEHA